MINSKPAPDAKKRGVKLAVVAGFAVAVSAGVAWAASEKARGHFFDRLDADNNEMISTAEIEPFTNRRFARFDANSDGSVSAVEIEEHLRKHLERRRDRILERFDAAGNGEITKDEYNASVSKMFAKADTNSDGSISRDEAKQARRMMHEGWRKHWRKHHGKPEN